MNIVAILLLLVLLPLIVINEYRIWKGKRILVSTYSYNHIFRFGLIVVFIGVCISLVAYYLTGSFDAFVTINVMTIAFVFVGGAKNYLFEYHIKRRGGKKAD
jgi:hypothetical protein